MKRYIEYETPRQLSAPLRFVTSEEIEFIEKVFDNEDGLHKILNLAMEWNPSCHAPQSKAVFHCNENIPVNRFANLHKRENENEEWDCVKSGDGINPTEIIFWVETTLQEKLGLGYWDYDEGRYGMFRSTSPEYFLSLEKEEQLKWGEFFNDKYFSRYEREMIGVTEELINELNNINEFLTH